MRKHPVTVRIVIDSMEIARRIGFSLPVDESDKHDSTSFFEAVKAEALRMYEAGEVQYETIYEDSPAIMHDEDMRTEWWRQHKVKE